MAEVRAGEPGAGRARARLVERTGITREPGVLEIEPSAPREGAARARRARRQNAVEHVDTAVDHFQDARGIADPHEVPRPVEREELRRPGGRLEHQRPFLADRQTAERVPVELELRDRGDRRAPKLRIGGALRDSEQELALRTRRLALSRRPERRATDRLFEPLARYVDRRTDVETHRDVGAELALDLGRELRGEASGLAVVDRAE